MMPTRLIAIMRKELLQLRRDRISLGLIVGLPVMQLLLFGYAINMDVRDLRAAVADQANTHRSRQFISELGQTQVLDIQQSVTTPKQLEDLLRIGKISVGVHIPADFDRRVIDPGRNVAHLLIDGTDPTIVAVAGQLATMPVQFDSGIAIGLPAKTMEIRPFYNPDGSLAFGGRKYSVQVASKIVHSASGTNILQKMKTFFNGSPRLRFYIK